MAPLRGEGPSFAPKSQYISTLPWSSPLLGPRCPVSHHLPPAPRECFQRVEFKSWVQRDPRQRPRTATRSVPFPERSPPCFLCSHPWLFWIKGFLESDLNSTNAGGWARKQGEGHQKKKKKKRKGTSPTPGLFF
jgi:hypothetical protein